jgi:hypothetical protein
VELSRNSLEAMASIFQMGINKGVFIDRHPFALADTLWALFSGIILWEESKKIINENKDYLKPTLDLAFEVFSRGVAR